ncbi:hypothetical protein I203_108585 [Kwoniella mangroviensis CBS 8507]|uniref:hypothetical protein n=1 Tax=Kwoniella mangroviensis CBS 8507 TaxID=1296122 RepID=UPI00080D340B|nr:uncharacterized protein I203_08012 [Kwoniella mangroviensis CBS 8507]OCF62878.1 hypothetical protein I203_08012 [Kwoniella mangroviensis CBS 8507]
MTCVLTTTPAQAPATNFSHPALLTGLASPPLTPISPTTTTTITKRNSPHVSSKLQPPEPSYAMLRAHHAYALKYTIAKLRWDQVNNLYLPGQDADWNHNEMINKLEKELHNVQEAQKGLDQFPNCFAPIAFPKAHGPLTKEKFEENKKAEMEREKKINEELEKVFPFLKRLFIGPLTKMQAKRDFLLREQLRDNDLEDISMLIPTENKKWLMAQQEKKQANHPTNRKSYEQQRYEKEKQKVAAHLEFLAKQKKEQEEKEPPRKPLGPLTREEWIATLPVYGPKTYDEVMLPSQREQRHNIISWLQRPWGTYNKKASKAMEALVELAKESLEEEKVLREKLRMRKEELKKVELIKALEAKKAEEEEKKNAQEDGQGEEGKKAEQKDEGHKAGEEPAKVAEAKKE